MSESSDPGRRSTSSQPSPNRRMDGVMRLSPDIRDAIAELNSLLRQRSLRILVGAGCSMPSGIPSWNALNLSLLRSMLEQVHPHLASDRARLDARARELMAVLGRDAVVDYVRSNLGSAYAEAVRYALYEGREAGELPIRSVQRQLAAIAMYADEHVGVPNLLATTNFDPLLELALERVRGATWADLRSPKPNGDEVEGLRVEHVHGWLCPQKSTRRVAQSGHLVFAESDYLDLAMTPDAPTNEVFSRFVNDTSILIVGMSLADPNIRRFLHRRRKTLPIQRNQNQRVFAILKRTGGPLDADLQAYWRQWDIEPLLIGSYEDIPRVLRDVQWGMDEVAPWFSASRAWVAERCPNPFSATWQHKVYRVLQGLRGWMRRYFSVELREHIELAVFLPASDRVGIWRVGTSRHEYAGPDASAEARAAAETRVLGVAPGKEQGVAGAAFGGSLATEELANGAGINLRFTEQMDGAWKRDWRSVMAVPILDGDDWLPVAVVTLTSTLGEPFWTRFQGDGDLTELKSALRQGVRALLGVSNAP